MNLIIDQGNTATKLALFDNEKLLAKTAFIRYEKDAVQDWLKKNVTQKVNVIVSNVTIESPDLSRVEIAEHVLFSHQTPVPVRITYRTPESLGLDRLANAVAVNSLNRGNNSLCIDMGTCIKYDLVSAEGTYLGGNISPGMNMRFKALNTFTDKLPNLDFAPLNQSYGTDTESSIRSGVIHGIHEEIKGFIQRYTQELGSLTIFMTGGDLNFFDKGFKNAIFADSDLTLKGLNEILRYNVEKV